MDAWLSELHNIVALQQADALIVNLEKTIATGRQEIFKKYEGVLFLYSN